MELTINNGICVTLMPEDFTNLLRFSSYFNPKSKNFQYFFLKEHLHFPIEDPIPSFRILVELANDPNSYRLPPYTDVTALLRLAGYILFDDELLTTAIIRSANELEFSSASVYAAHNNQFNRSIINIQFHRLGVNPVSGHHLLCTTPNYRTFRQKLRDNSRFTKFYISNIIPHCHCPACAEYKLKNLLFEVPRSPNELNNWPNRKKTGSEFGNFKHPTPQPW